MSFYTKPHIILNGVKDFFGMYIYKNLAGLLECFVYFCTCYGK